MTELEKIMKKIQDLNWTYNFLEYIQLRKKGLKKRAQTLLNEFFIEFNLQDKNARRIFIDYTCELAFITNESEIYLPYNMYNDLFLPEINTWLKEEPNNSIPHKWSNEIENNRKALELNSKDQIAIEKFSNYIIGKISMNQHEISYGFGYDGNPDDDIVLINFFQPFVKNLTNIDKQEKIIKTLEELKNCAVKYKK